MIFNTYNFCFFFFLGEFLRELYFVESEFKSCILTNEQRALNVSKYLLVEDKQIELKNVINLLKSGMLFFKFIILLVICC